MGHERVAGRHLSDLTARRLVDADANFDSSQGDRVRRRSFAFARVVDDTVPGVAWVVVIFVIRALIYTRGVVVVLAVEFIVETPCVVDIG